MSKNKNINTICAKLKIARRVIFMLLTIALFLPHKLTAQQRVVAERGLTICKGKIAPINLNKVLGVSLSTKAGNWYNSSNEKVSNIFVLPNSSKIGDLFDFYFLVESKDIYCGLKKDDRYNVSISINGLSKPEASVTVQPTCQISTGTITVTAPVLNANEQYVVTGTKPVVAAQGNTSGIFSGLEPGVYTVKVENTLTKCISESLSLTINERPSVCPVDSNDPTTGSDYVRISFDPNEGGSLTPNIQTNTTVSKDGKIYIDVKIGTDYGEILLFVPTAKKPNHTFTDWNPIIPYGVVTTTSEKDFIAQYTSGDSTCLIKVYNYISPNNDGFNDYLQIDCIDSYPNNTLEIFNRWGNTVYKKKGYKSDTRWSGISNGRAVIYKDKRLPTGVYFYILNRGDGSDEIKSWLYISTD